MFLVQQGIYPKHHLSGRKDMKHPPSYDSTPETRRRMAHVSLKNGRAERCLARLLWHSGVRYRKNYKCLPGSPDIAITKGKIAVFGDGEFWHGKNWDERKARLKSNRDYWIEKIEENIARDKRNNESLSKMGWLVIHFWEKEVLKDPNSCVQKVLSLIIQKGTHHVGHQSC